MNRNDLAVRAERLRTTTAPETAPPADSPPSRRATAADLERAALAAHRAGTSWSAFFAAHGSAMSAVEPWSVQAYHRLFRKLMHVVLCGNADGQHPPSSGLLWEDDREQARN